MSGNEPKYNLEERTFEIAKRARDYVKVLPKTIANIEYGRQLIRASGPVGANYIEANESLGKKDFCMRIKISKKESKESAFWLRLTESKTKYLNEQKALILEAQELMKIFGAILKKSE